MEQASVTKLNQMNVNSLEGEYDRKSQGFGTTIWKGVITFEQAHHIVDRAYILYSRMEQNKEKIIDLYGDESTQKLMDNFAEIIDYSDKIIEYSPEESFDDFFQKLENFCGQIENILKMIRYYYTMFKE